MLYLSYGLVLLSLTLILSTHNDNVKSVSRLWDAGNTPMFFGVIFSALMSIGAVIVFGIFGGWSWLVSAAKFSVLYHLVLGVICWLHLRFVIWRSRTSPRRRFRWL